MKAYLVNDTELVVARSAAEAIQLHHFITGDEEMHVKPADPEMPYRAGDGEPEYTVGELVAKLSYPQWLGFQA